MINHIVYFSLKALSRWTAVWADMLSETTVDRVGSKAVNLKTTGHEKVRVSVCLAARADGSKLKPMIVFKGAVRETKKLNDEFKGKCVIASSVNAWMNEPLSGLIMFLESFPLLEGF